MARPQSVSREKLRELVRLRGPVSATELAAALGANRTTITRMMEEFGDSVAVLGATRSTRYVMRRPVRNAGDRWPIYRIGETGQASEWAEVESLHEQRWRVTWTGAPPGWAGHFVDRNGLWIGYPFFLGDLRPQGFMGREVAARVARALDVPRNPASWSDEHTQLYLQAEGDDLAGSLVVGDVCLRRALAGAFSSESGTLVAENGRAAAYPDMAERAVAVLPGSSAGGEQPKFLTRIGGDRETARAVLVKFSPPLNQPVGERVADLLLAEYHAHETLAAQSLALPGALIVDAGGRRFLEVPRFDRVGGMGRRGVVSLYALHNAVIGSGQSEWPAEVGELSGEGLTDATALATARRLHAFGELIGNTDMHPGNLAFWLDDALPFRVTPSYDMLPMLWAPGPQGEIMERSFAPAPPLPAAREAWSEAAGWAAVFWERLAGDARLSATFQGYAEQASVTVERLRRHFA